MRDYWAYAAAARSAVLVPESKEWSFAQMADTICLEYEDEAGD